MALPRLNGNLRLTHLKGPSDQRYFLAVHGGKDRDRPPADMLRARPPGQLARLGVDGHARQGSLESELGRRDTWLQNGSVADLLSYGRAPGRFFNGCGASRQFCNKVFRDRTTSESGILV